MSGNRHQMLRSVKYPELHALLKRHEVHTTMMNGAWISCDPWGASDDLPAARIIRASSASSLAAFTDSLYAAWSPS